MARRPTYRPLTRLLALLVVVIAAYATVFVGGLTPKLGIDLDGGTTVTLQPKTLADGKAPSSAILDQAVDILRNRVNGKGVSGAEVTNQAPFIVITVPGASRSDLTSIEQTAQLYFREEGTQPGGTGSQGGVPEALPTTTTTTIPTPGVSVSGAVVGTAPPSGSVVAPTAAATGSAAASGAPATAAVVTPVTGSPVAPSVAAAPSATGGAATAPVNPRPPVRLAATPVPTLVSETIDTSSTAPTAALPTALGGTPTAAVPTSPGATLNPSTTVASPPVATPDPVVASAAPAAAAKPAFDDPKATTALTYTEADAEARFTDFTCADNDDVTRAADFTPESWAFACSYQQGVLRKYLLMPAAVLGTDVSSASAQPQTSNSGTTSITTGEWVTTLSFKNDKFADLTTKTAISGGNGHAVAIVLDGMVESDPTNQTEIASDAQISGNFTQAEAQDLANNLNYGSLPLSFQDSPTTETISATLGKASLEAGLIAGLVGLIIVTLYCFVYYRALGFITTASLLVSGSMIYACVVLLGHTIGFTLSLAGIAGFIVAIGITADSFVVYYERLKDEVREGKAPRVAAEKGWLTARRTILSADAVSLLAAVVLYAFTVGDVRGFALTLGLSTLLDLVTVFFFTKPLVTLLIRRPFFSSGSSSGLTAATPSAPLRRRPGSTPLEA